MPRSPAQTLIAPAWRIASVPGRPAIDNLAAIEREGQAVRPGLHRRRQAVNLAYLRAALRLSRPGSVVVVDNVVRSGGVIDHDSADPSIRGTRRCSTPSPPSRASTTAIQTVGSKDWDGFLIALVEG